VEKFHVGTPEIYSWVLTVVSIYAALFGLGWLIMGMYLRGIIALILCVLTVIAILKEIEKMDWKDVKYKG